MNSKHHIYKSIDEYIQKQEDGVASTLIELRHIFMKNREIGEEIKWNSPCFFYKGEIKNYNPKEYKREIAVVNLNNKGFVMLVFPNGAWLKGKTDLKDIEFKDKRMLAKFYNIEDVLSKEESLINAIKKNIQFAII